VRESVCVCVYVYVCMYVCVYVCMYVCMCVCVYIYIYIYIYIKHSHYNFLENYDVGTQSPEVHKLEYVGLGNTG